MREFYLLSKPNCPLCDQAHELIQAVALKEPVQLHLVDISQQPDLQAEYAWLVPVLVRAIDDAELKWPFGDKLESFLQS